MGFRFRKSFGGKYFKVNISKSGIGYSYGIPGYRKTKLANGRTRTTTSIPGTGISYVTETKGKKINQKNNNNNFKTNNVVETNTLNDIDNVDECLYENSSHEEFIQALKKARNYWSYSITLIVLGIIFLFSAIFPFAILMIIGGIYLYRYFAQNLKVNVEYNIEDEVTSYKSFKEVWLNINNCKTLWEITSEETVLNRKTNAGAARNVDRKTTKFEEEKLPYLNIGEEKVLKLKLRKKEILFLKDKLLIIEKTKIAGVDYKDLCLEFSSQRFIESSSVPKDATIVDYTWTYVNKNGQPDKRYSNNRKIPVCMYGKINIFDINKSFNIELQMSNYEIFKEISNQAKESIK